MRNAKHFFNYSIHVDTLNVLTAAYSNQALS